MSNRFERGESQNRKVPELTPPLYEHPTWWHPRGSKMRVIPGEFEGELLIQSSAAKLKISRDPEKQRWNVDWKIRHTKNCYSQGRTEWQDDEFDGAFGLTDSEHLHGGHVLKRFGGDSAEQGGYIRWKNFLNIPNPGTGHDYDPNVSLLLKKEIIEEAIKFKNEYAGRPLLRRATIPTNVSENLKAK